MSRLSTPLSELKPFYDVIVVGSGYGGAIAASRMARCGLTVAVLEKGKEFVSGEFPTTLAEATKEMQMSSSEKHIGSKNGLYEFVAGQDITVFKGCGLGGTSLINANVSIEPEPAVFNDPRWPVEIRSNLDSFREGLARAKAMLKPLPYPEGRDGYPILNKTKGMRKSAAAMGAEFRLAEINVSFHDYVNDEGVERKKCNNCGDCVTGCNHNAKNTTATNYLPDARNHGVEIFVEAGVSHIKRHGDRWTVYFEPYNACRDVFDAPLLFTQARMVFLSGGALGSTEILLRSARHGLSLSPMLGKRFTGNGDVLGFGYNNDHPINGIGLGTRLIPGKVDKVGPCITGIIDLRNRNVLEDGMTLEEGSVPGPIRDVLKATLMPLSALIGKDTDSGFKDFIREKWREVKSFFRGPFSGALDRTQIYLVMSHDDGQGQMFLDKDKINISWPGVGKQKIFHKVSDTLHTATAALGGTYVRNPVWTKILGYDVITVHPLGGCVMGQDASTAVVDHKGQVFAGATGTALHPGLYVMDGAIIPRPLGTNPLLTISALAERNCKLIAEELGLFLSYGHGVRPSNDKAEHTGVQFTEKMTGYFSPSEKHDYEKALAVGRNEQSSFEFTLTITIPDIDAFVEDPNHRAGMFGTVRANRLSEAPMTISNGQFKLFVKHVEKVKRMCYDMILHTEEGRNFFFSGFKEIEDERGPDMWSDTSVLYITLYDGEGPEAPVLGKGILHIEITDFTKQLGTMKAIHPKSTRDAVSAIGKFGKLFAGNIWESYAEFAS